MKFNVSHWSKCFMQSCAQSSLTGLGCLESRVPRTCALKSPVQQYWKRKSNAEAWFTSKPSTVHHNLVIVTILTQIKTCIF